MEDTQKNQIKMQVEVVTKSEPKRSVLIKSPEFSSYEESQRWFNLAKHVKVEWIKKGPADVTLAQTPDGKDEVVFIKNTGQAPSQSGQSGHSSYNGYPMQKVGGYQKPSYQKPAFNPEFEKEKQEDIKAQACVKQAIQAIKVHNETIAKSEEEKVNITYNTLRNQALMIWNVVDSLKEFKEEEKQTKGGVGDGRQEEA